MDNKFGDSKKLRIQLFHLLALAKVKLISLFTEKKIGKIIKNVLSRVRYNYSLVHAEASII